MLNDHLGSSTKEGHTAEPLPYATPLELYLAFKRGARFVLHYHGRTLNVERMEPREKVVYVQPPGFPVKVYPDGRSAEGPSQSIRLAFAGAPNDYPIDGDGVKPQGADKPQPAHSKSEYKRRVAMGDVDVATPQRVPDGPIAQGASQVPGERQKEFGQCEVCRRPVHLGRCADASRTASKEAAAPTEPADLPLSVEAQHVLLDALENYADPGFYHACSFRFDPPAGGFDKDFSHDEEYGRLMPGKLAREALQRANALNGQVDRSGADGKEIRAEFEAWAKGRFPGMCLERDPDIQGKFAYLYDTAQCAYFGYVAGRGAVDAVDARPRRHSLCGTCMTPGICVDDGCGRPDRAATASTGPQGGKP